MEFIRVHRHSIVFHCSSISYLLKLFGVANCLRLVVAKKDSVVLGRVELINLDCSKPSE